MTHVMRTWISRLLVVAMLANLAVWSSPELAETMERLSAAGLALDTQGAPHEAGADQCKHGCASHCGSHVQWQAGVVCTLPAVHLPNTLPVAGSAVPAGVDRSLPFRPPLAFS